MDKVQWAAFKSAIKTLDAGPRRIAKAREEYNQADAYMKDPANSRRYSEIGKENYYKTAAAKRDTVIKGEVAKIAQAIETVREYRTFPGEKIDLGSVKLMNALTVVNTLGKRMRPDEQLAIAEQFRGEPAALHFMADLYRKNGYYYADAVDAMAKPISSEALDNMEYCVASYEQLGNWPFDEKCYWTQHEFEEAASRYGFDVVNSKDAYVEALKTARNGQAPEVQRIFSEAIAQIQNGSEYLTDAQKAEIFNNATAKVDALAEANEAAEIARQANTQETLDLIAANSGATTIDGVHAEGSAD